MADELKAQILALLPVRNMVLFPQMLLPLSVGRPSSIAAVQAAMATEEKEIVVVAQRTDAIESVKWEDLFTIGTRATIRKMSRPAEGLIEMVVQGMERVTLLKAEQTEPFYKVNFQPNPLPDDKGPE